ncbi:DUF4276 family protein [Pseudomonas aeruginosa]|uniref:hypothetical protein n=1 Tax=Pseudomonas aeruginosa TaxID=287 RepID=UPI0009A3846E|nr:hypothetical protein [Pseudomonas aeruginosa]EKX1098257.1 hypothetical protein [Pseudomonas aeruginosa]MBX5800216.1 hypothetical protein [Pseudomonas aeruginosa]MBX5812202.1 hypothetical protein [Pseudomonas aeruginosa]MCW5225891.1 hypothetical protein [Pseudomonas aeruginosa]MDI2515534.1 DUF4276 family protein [Pseudomonas aeruginosa]
MEECFYVVGEDQACCSLATVMIIQLGGEVKLQSIEHGYGPFVAKIRNMNSIAQNVMPVVMLADGDQDTCVVAQRNKWMPPHPAGRFCLRLAVREAESWILSDREGLSQFADVSPAIIPVNPDELPDPKRSLLSVMQRSRKRVLRDEMLPGRSSNSLVGLGYNLHLKEFIETVWSAERAALNSPSLSRALNHIASLIP